MNKITNFIKNEIKYPTLTFVFVLIVLMLAEAQVTIHLPYFREFVAFILLGWLIINIKSIKCEYYFLVFLVYLLILIFSTSGYDEFYDFNENVYTWAYDYFKNIFIKELLCTSLIYLVLIAPIKDEYIKRKSHTILKWIFVIGALIIDIVGFILKPGIKQGLTVNVNTLAAINFFAIMSLLSISFDKKKFLILLLVPIYVFVILITGSRGSMLGFLFSAAGILMYIFVFGGNRKKKLILAAMLLLIVIIASITLGPKIVSYILRGKNYEGADFYQIMNMFTSGRWYIWTKTFPEAIKNNYIFGRGLVSLRQINYCDQLFTIGVGTNLFFAHNMFLDMILATGFVGLFYFLIFLVIRFVNAIKNKDRVVDAILLVAMLIYFSFDTPFLWLGMGAMCFYVIYG